MIQQLRVAYLNRAPSAYPGGDVLSINEVIEALKPLGVDAKYVHGEWGPKDLEPFDLIHVKHCNFSWSKWNFEQVWASGKPYVVQPVFYPRTDLGMSGGEIARAIVGAAAVIPYTWAEWRSLLETLDWDVAAKTERVQCIPNGTAAMFYGFEYAGHRATDVLCVAARGGKGADVVEAICRERRWSFLCATDVPYEAIPGVYRNAKVFVSASDSDRMSRTVGEALCSGCRVISSDKNWGNTYYPGLCVYPYGDAEMLEGLIGAALAAEPWNWQPNEAARLLTWPLVANLLRVVYEEALA